MFILLSGLQRLRRTIKMPRSPRPGSLAVRHVDAGSCNGCEHELSATMGPHYDMGRHGLSVAASPRHADALLVTGTITSRMVGPLRAAYESLPEPRLVVALGDCACGHGNLGHADECAGPIADLLPVDMSIPGCPPTPETIEQYLLDALEKGRRRRGRLP